MVFCKDCAFCKLTLINKLVRNYNYARCTHPKATERKEDEDYKVSGKQGTVIYRFCAGMRSLGQPCGHDGLLFLEKGNKVAAVEYKLDGKAS